MDHRKTSVGTRLAYSVLPRPVIDQPKSVYSVPDDPDVTFFATFFPLSIFRFLATRERVDLFSGLTPITGLGVF